MTDLPSELVDQIAQTIGDPGSIAPRNGHKESTSEWAARAVSYVLVASGYRREADVRREVARSLGIPALHALRSIPDGEIRNGGVVMDGAQVRERLRQAYLDIQTPVDEPATALEPPLPLPVADGREVEQGQERSEEQQ